MSNAQQAQEQKDIEFVLDIANAKRLVDQLSPRIVRRKLGDRPPATPDVEELLSYTTYLFEERLHSLLNEFLQVAEDDDQITINIEPFAPST